MGETEKIETHRIRCFSKLKMFLLAITCAFISKTLSGSYMNSMLTQIERQFNIPTSLVGFINGSFEIECVKEVKSLMWVYVLVGNMIRGIGETPIMPLGISYIEDFAKSENSPLYIGFVETGAIIGPLFGLLLASFCANVYVDIGSVNTDELTITPIDTRWVGAWWFGILICAGVNVLTAIPFFFLPKTLAKEGSKDDADIVKNDNEEKQKEVFHNCSCIQTLGNSSAVLGLCDKGHDCSMMLQYFLILSSVSCFIYSLSAIPGYMVLLRYLYLGLPAALRGLSYIPAVFILIILRKYRLPGENTTSGTLPAEAKVTGNEDQEMDQTCKVLNNNVLNTKM
ncbi:Solute carrier organic anion transporter family member 1A5 [Myotis davidii]|uniref:Solute carrier organic anion transporter family member 1A5 n=1 Tax=Myotis davidii TaxID=225400 RepID=L5LBX1_MYODS|nr:Solute carrier organic anion transporter family member 1A5 [Myotis davidii]